MKRIDISTPKYPNTFAIVDDEDFESVSRFHWYVDSYGYAKNCAYMGTVRGKQLKATMSLHCLIMRPPKHMQVDHIDHNPLDCRRSKMRVCTNQENCQNQVSTKGTSSKWKGVSWDKARAKWRADIGHNYKVIYLGLFDSEEDAARAYDMAAEELFGEFGLLNFPKEAA
jgi:hypothetical protein